MSDLIEIDGKVTLSKDRNLVALEATWEIDQLCGLLRKVVTLDDGMECLAVRGLLARIGELNGVIMSALGDECEATSELALRVRLDHPAESV